MEPLTIGLIAGGAYLLAKGTGAGATPAPLAASLSIDQLMMMYAGKPWSSVPSDVLRRLQQHASNVRNSGQKRVKFLIFLDPGENARLPADWHYITGRAPDFSQGDWGGPASAQGGSPPGNLVSRVTWIDDKVSVLANVFRTLTPIVGGVVGTVVGGPAGTAAGAAAGKALSGFEDFSAHMRGQVKRGPPKRRVR